MKYKRPTPKHLWCRPAEMPQLLAGIVLRRYLKRFPEEALERLFRRHMRGHVYWGRSNNHNKFCRFWPTGAALCDTDFRQLLTIHNHSALLSLAINTSWIRDYGVAEPSDLVSVNWRGKRTSIHWADAAQKFPNEQIMEMIKEALLDV